MRYLILNSGGDRVMSLDLLNIKNLSAGFTTRAGMVKALDDVSLTIKGGSFLGLAGESGCGKSTLAFCIMRLLEDNGKILKGQIFFKGRDLLPLTKREMKDIRWNQISMVFQSAMSSLNPVLTIKTQLLDGLFTHKNLRYQEALNKVSELMELVDLSPDRLDEYPHQLSGGMRQRVSIAMALILNPDLVIMDEPTTALDVVVQRMIMEKIQELRQKIGFSVLFITHDLSLLIEVADQLAVMYGGRIVELGPVGDVYRKPLHPYTIGLMNSFPPLTGDDREFGGIPGKPPDLLSPPIGCGFYPRCKEGSSACERERSSLIEVEEGHFTSCLLRGGGR